MRRALLVFFWALVACNPYDPNLGEIPFLCGTDPPRCPEGYLAIVLTGTRCECQRNDIAVDPNQYECSDDPQESPTNDSLGTATETGVDGSGTNPQARSFNAAVCPASDIDLYRVTAPTGGSIVQVSLTFDVMRSPPAVELLNSDGATLSTGESTVVGTITIAKSVDGGGTYFVKVSDEMSVNYRVTLNVLRP